MVCEKVEAALKSALNQLQEVFAGWGNAYADIGVNRIKLLVIRLIAHCNALKRDNYLLSPDFFGEIRDLLRVMENVALIMNIKSRI